MATLLNKKTIYSEARWNNIMCEPGNSHTTVSDYDQHSHQNQNGSFTNDRFIFKITFTTIILKIYI